MHESRFRSVEVMERLAWTRVTVCGAGALGSHVVEGLARAGATDLRVIDRDRVEEQNLSTQPWELADVGSLKAKLLANALYRAVGVEVDARAKELTAKNVDKLLADSDVVVDAFDNSVARGDVTESCARSGTPCLHAGLASDYAEILWNERYRVPSDAGDDVCDYPLARNLAIWTAALACELVIRFVATGERRNLTLTFGDLSIRELPG